MAKVQRKAGMRIAVRVNVVSGGDATREDRDREHAPDRRGNQPAENIRAELMFVKESCQSFGLDEGHRDQPFEAVGAPVDLRAKERSVTPAYRVFVYRPHRLV